MAPTPRELVVHDPVRAEIWRRVENLRTNFQQMQLGEIARCADTLRALAIRHGLEPVQHVAEGLSDALARDGRGAIIPTYLQTMLEAVYCESHDVADCQSFLASVSVRLAS